MNRQKAPRALYFIFLFFLFFAVSFSVLGEFAQNKAAFLFLKMDSRDNVKSDVSLRFNSEIFYSPPGVQNRTQGGRLWRQLLSFVFLLMFLGTAGKILFRKYCFHGFHYQKLFHSLVDSLSLGGQAPPYFAY